MALSAAKLTELPPLFSSISFLPLRKHSHRSHFLKPFCSSVRSTKLPKTPSRNTRIHETPSSSIRKWPNNQKGKTGFKITDPKQNPKSEPEQSRTNTTAIDRIVLRLRNLGLGSDDDDEELLGLGLELGDANAELDREKDLEIGDEKLGDLLKRDWVRPDTILAEDDDEYDDDSDAELLPWERDVTASSNEEENGVGLKKKAVRAPTLADLTIEDGELRRLRRMGMTLRERVNVPKAGITKEVLEKIHDKWRTCELVRLKFHEELATDMRTAHEIVERRTGGLVTWRSGSVMVVYRGANYEGPFSKRANTEDNTPFVPDVSSADKPLESIDAKIPILETCNPVTDNRVKKMTDEETEYNKLLDGLGPRFEDWWGTGVLPVDADLLPPTVPGYKTPFRLLPTGMRSRLTNAEMTDLRKLSKSLPCHFALGRNRNHQGLATAIIKLWEKSLLVKIAVKRGIQNTNNKIMAEELKNLTGGVLLMRNKYFIVMYRGKDFLPPTVEAALAEREQMAKKIQDVEEKSRGITTSQSVSHETEAAQAGTLAEFYEAQARWGTDISAEEREKMKEEAVRAERAKVVRRLEHKLAISQAKKLKAERLLSKIVESWVPVSPSDDQETITDEERAMYRRVGLRMKAYLPLGIRGVFDGVIENMHLHWKHRELVKLISKEKQLSFVEESARLLEYESGGILVAIERVPKGYALIYYRGKNYRRPISLRPRNLLTKAKALKRRVALQRYEALSQHISELEKNIEQTKQEIGESQDTQSTDFWNSEERAQLSHISESTESEDEASMMYSDFDEDEDDWNDDDDDDEDENSQFSSIEEDSEDL